MRSLHSSRFVAVVLAAALATGVSSSVSHAEEDVYKFGGVFTLSGPASFLGLFEEAAARLAVEQFMKGDCIVEAIPAQPCEGGGLKIGDKKIPIQWTAYDDKSEAKDAIDDVNSAHRTGRGARRLGSADERRGFVHRAHSRAEKDHKHMFDLFEPSHDDWPKTGL